jgi:hypothetical protein
MRLGLGGETVQAITLDSLNLTDVSVIKVSIKLQLWFSKLRSTLGVRPSHCTVQAITLDSLNLTDVSVIKVRQPLAAPVAAAASGRHMVNLLPAVLQPATC